MGEEKFELVTPIPQEMFRRLGFIDHRQGVLVNFLPRPSVDVEIETPVFRVHLTHTRNPHQKTVMERMFEFLPCAEEPNQWRFQTRGNYTLRLLKGPKPFERFTTNWEGRSVNEYRPEKTTVFGKDGSVYDTLPSELWHCENGMQQSFLSYICGFVRKRVDIQRIYLEIPGGVIELYYPAHAECVKVCPVCFGSYNRYSAHYCESMMSTDDGTIYLLPRDRLPLDIRIDPAAVIPKLLRVPCDCREGVGNLVKCIDRLVNNDDDEEDDSDPDRDDAGMTTFVELAALVYAKLKAKKQSRKRPRPDSGENAE